jgi:hypothetical protein
MRFFMVQQQITDAVTTPTPFPSEIVDLPSKGFFYPEDSPLRSGQIEIKYMTAKEEDILTSTNLIQKGVVLDKLMDALIVTKNVKCGDLLLGDLNAVMIAARILGYGKDYPISITCPSCGNTVEQTVDLSELQTENEPTDGALDKFKVVLPLSKAEVTLKLLTRQDELNIEKEVKSLKKINSDINADATTRLRAMITAVDGDTSKTAIWKFVDSLLVRDTRYLREYYKEHIPDVNFSISIDCNCETTETVRLPIGIDFFWPDARV